MATGNSTAGFAAKPASAGTAGAAGLRPGITTVNRMFDDDDLIDYSDHEEEYYLSLLKPRTGGSTGPPTDRPNTTPAADMAGLKLSGAGMSTSVYTGTVVDSSATGATATIMTAITTTAAIPSADNHPTLTDFDFDIDIDFEADADAGAEADVAASYDESGQGHQTRSGGAKDMIDYNIYDDDDDDDDDELNHHHDGQDPQPTESRHSMAESGDNADHDGLGRASLGPAGGRPEPATHPAVHAHDVDEIDYDDDDYQDQLPADEGDEADFGPIDLGPFDDDDDAVNGKPDALSTVEALDALDAPELHQPEHASPALAAAPRTPDYQVEAEEPDQDRHDRHPQDHTRHPAYGQEDEITYDDDEEPHPGPSPHNEAENAAGETASLGSRTLRPSAGLDHTVNNAMGNTVDSAVDSAVDNTDDSTDGSGFDNTLDNTLDTILDDAIDHTIDLVMEKARACGLTDPDWPHITVSYKGDEYPMFSSPLDQDDDQDKMAFFSDLSILDFSIDRLLAALRNELSEEITTDDELVLQIDELGLEYSESTRMEYLSLVNLHQLLDVYRQLVENQGLDRFRAMSAFLSVRPTPLSRLDLVVRSAHSGEPLDAIARYFPAPASETVEPDGAGHAPQQQEDDLDDPVFPPGQPAREPGYGDCESVHRSNVAIKEEEPQPQQPDDGNTRDSPQPCYSPHFCVCAKCVHSFSLRTQAEEMRSRQLAQSRSQAGPPSSSPRPQQAPAPASSPRTAELDSGSGHVPAPAHSRLDANRTIPATHDYRDDRDGRDGELQTHFHWPADPGHPEPGHPDHGDADEPADLPEAHLSPVAGEQTSGSSTVIGDDFRTPSQPRPATNFSFLFEGEKEIDWREDGDSDSAEDEPKPAPPGIKPSPQGSKRPREEEEEAELLDLEDGQDVKRRRAIGPADPSTRY